MAMFSPWSSVGDSMSGLGQSVGGVLLQRKLMEIRAQQEAQQLANEQQRLGIMRDQLNAQLPVFAAQADSERARIPLFGAQTKETTARIPGIEQQGLGEELKNIMHERTRGNADTAGRAAQIQAALRTPGLPPEAMQPNAENAIGLLQQNAMLPPPGAQPAQYPVSAIAQMLGALMKGRQMAEGVTAPAVAGRMAEPTQVGPGQTLFDQNTLASLFTAPAAEKQFGFHSAPWGTYSGDTGKIEERVPKEYESSDPIPSGTAMMGLSRSLPEMLDEIPGAKEALAGAIGQYTNRIGTLGVAKRGGIPTFASEADIPAGFKGEAIVNGRRAKVE